LYYFRECILFVFCHSTWLYSHYPVQLIMNLAKFSEMIFYFFTKPFFSIFLALFSFLWNDILFLYLAGKYGGKITATSIVETPKNREKKWWRTSYEINTHKHRLMHARQLLVVFPFAVFLHSNYDICVKQVLLVKY